MGLRIWAYYFKNAFINIVSHRLIHAISIGTISISLLLLGLFILLFVNIDNWISAWGKSLTMSVYLKDGIEKGATKKIKSIILNLPDVEMKGFISKEKAMMNLREALGVQSGLLDGLAKNPLPASFEITFKNIRDNYRDPKKIKEYLEKIQGVDEVQYTKQWHERFEGLVYILRMGGLIIGGLLCLAVLFIITNTIKLTIYSRRNEIEIFKLVGATDWFIKIPFLIEGAIQGIFSGLLALSVLFTVYYLFSFNKVHVFGLPVLDIVFLPVEYTAFILSLSFILGLAGGFIAIGRFFKL